MKRTTRQTFAACAMPLLLLFTTQGGSCGGGRAAGDNSNQAGAARPADARPASNAAANAAAGAATPALREANTNGAGAAEVGGREGGAAMNDGQRRRLEEGVWGGTGITLDVKGGAAEVEFDCARGRVGEFGLDAEGNFSARGTLANERGGPVRLGEEPKPVPATYTGKVTGETMTLRVSTEDGDDLDFTLRRGSHGRLRKCL
jgi:hypothetical protein